MKKLFTGMIMIIAFFSVSSFADTVTHGWKFSENRKDGNTAMYNVGEQGGVLTLVCDVKTHKLQMNYTYKFKEYDLYVFRKFGVTDMESPSNEGKFIVGMDSTTQHVAYYNVLEADKAFSITRFPIGAKGTYEKAIAANKNIPAIQQEGDEYFLAGDDWKPMLKILAASCPINPEQDKPIF